MDRTLVSFNLPNLITVPIMAFGGFVLAALIWQLFKRTPMGAAMDNGDGSQD